MQAIFISFNSITLLYGSLSLRKSIHNFQRSCCCCHHMRCECPPISCGSFNASDSKNYSFGSLSALIPCLVTRKMILKQRGHYSRCVWDVLLGRPLAASWYLFSKLFPIGSSLADQMLCHKSALHWIFKTQKRMSIFIAMGEIQQQPYHFHVFIPKGKKAEHLQPCSLNCI